MSGITVVPEERYPYVGLSSETMGSSRGGGGGHCEAIPLEYEEGNITAAEAVVHNPNVRGVALAHMNSRRLLRGVQAWQSMDVTA